MRWFRLWAELIDDPKQHNLDDKSFRIFILLLCLAAELERDGEINLSEKDVSWRLRISQNILTRTYKKLVDLSIITNENGVIQFLNWEKRQFRSDCSTERVKRFRNVARNNIETSPETETETELLQEVNLLSSIIPENPGKMDPCPHQKIIELYHLTCPMLPRVIKWTEERKAALKSRWNMDKEYQSIEWWESFFTKVKESDFLTGQSRAGNGHRPFLASLDWLIKKANFVKVIEGKYVNRDSWGECNF